MTVDNVHAVRARCGAAALARRPRLSQRPSQSVRLRRLPHGRRRTPSIADLTNLRAIVLHDVTRPIVNFSYAVDRALWGDAAVRLSRDERAAAHAERRPAVPARRWQLDADSARRRVRRRRALRRASDDDRGGRLHQRPLRSAVRDVLPARAAVRPPLDARRRRRAGRR